MNVDCSRAGAKLGIGRYESYWKAPLTVVEPSEWAQIDFETPSVRELIRGDAKEEDKVFDSIESTPIVRYQSFSGS